MEGEQPEVSGHQFPRAASSNGPPTRGQLRHSPRPIDAPLASLPLLLALQLALRSALQPPRCLGQRPPAPQALARRLPRPRPSSSRAAPLQPLRLAAPQAPRPHPSFFRAAPLQPLRMAAPAALLLRRAAPAVGTRAAPLVLPA